MKALQKCLLITVVFICVATSPLIYASEISDVAKGLNSTSLDERTVISDLKEALSIRTAESAKLVFAENSDRLLNIKI